MSSSIWSSFAMASSLSDSSVSCVGCRRTNTDKFEFFYTLSANEYTFIHSLYSLPSFWCWYWPPFSSLTSEHLSSQRRPLLRWASVLLGLVRPFSRRWAENSSHLPLRSCLGMCLGIWLEIYWGRLSLVLLLLNLTPSCLLPFHFLWVWAFS